MVFVIILIIIFIIILILVRKRTAKRVGKEESGKKTLPDKPIEGFISSEPELHEEPFLVPTQQPIANQPVEQDAQEE